MFLQLTVAISSAASGIVAAALATELAGVVLGLVGLKFSTPRTSR